MLCLWAVVQTNQLSSTSGVAQIHSSSKTLPDPAVPFWSCKLTVAVCLSHNQILAVAIFGAQVPLLHMTMKLKLDWLMTVYQCVSVPSL